MSFKSQKIMRRVVLLVVTAFMAAVLMAPSCLKGGAWFSHEKHVEDQELDCDICHSGSGDGKMAGAPSAEVCTACHEEAEKYSGIAGKLTEKWPRIKALPPDGKFSHRTHNEAGVECSECHGKVGSGKRVTYRHMPDEQTCRSCHAEKGVGNDCSTCHSEINAETAPEDHGQAWMRFHGDSAKSPVEGDRCMRCHQESKCDSCHSSQKPRDHTYTWKDYGHGVASRIDRSRCATCHRTDYCTRCHRENPPRSHRGAWGSPSDRHCLSCHVGGGSVQNCRVCHGGGVGHRNAPFQPAGAPHDSATDCRACHTGASLGHPDNGDNCTICHK